MKAPAVLGTHNAPSASQLHANPVGLLQRQCACGKSPGIDGTCEECQQQRLRRKPLAEIQKFAVSEPRDPLEQEADRVAQSVLDDGKANNTAVREIGSADRLRRKPNRWAVSTIAVPPVVGEALSTSGQPLDGSTRNFFESRFGHDFSEVRIHADHKADESASAVQALAYTVGSDVVFGAGQYQPHTSSGRRLIAHELAHVVQQRGGTSAPLPDSPPPATPRIQRQAATEDPSMCSATQRATVEMVAQNAREQLVDPAINRLRRLTSGASPDEASKRVVNALSRHFHSDKENVDETANKVAEQLRLIDEKLAGGVVTRCPGESDATCKSGSASWSRPSETLTLCPWFFSEKVEDIDKMEVLVHEFAHVSGLQVNDLGYAAHRIYPRLKASEALSNADSYSQFVVELFSGPSTDGGASKKDVYAGCAPSQQAVLESALAKAEAWNSQASDVLSIEGNFNAYAGIIGGFTRFDPKAKTNAPARFNDSQFRGYAETYSKAAELFKKKIVVQCEAPESDFCEERASQFDRDTLSICTRGMEKGADDYFALQILWDLYSSLGSLSSVSEGLLAQRLYRELMDKSVSSVEESPDSAEEDGIPTGETFIAEGWGEDNDRTMALWKQQLLPEKGNFKGLQVREEDPADEPHVNSCCDPGEVGCFKKISGGTWTVEADNTYKTDTVGLIAPLVEKYQRRLRGRNQEVCGYRVPQRMVVIGPNNGTKEYVMNQLIYVITKDSVICGKVNKFGAQWITKKFPE